MSEQSSTAEAGPRTQNAYFAVESRPNSVIGALYDELPFPVLGPVQEVVFDLGITALQGPVELNGVVIKGYSGHQMLFEQRWPARVIRQRTGQADLHIAAGTGLAVRSMQFLLPGYELLSSIEVTTVVHLPAAETENAAASQDADDAAAEGQTRKVQAALRIPVRFHEQRTDLHFPLRGTWWAIQAADWSDQHKQEVYSQPYAIDFVKLGPDNRFFHGRGLALEEHYSWDEPVYATAGGKVAQVIFDMPDLQPGQLPDPRIFRGDPRRLLGNSIAISHANGEFSFYGHLQQASLQVREGDLIKRGALLGRVGNSGHTPGPQLHFHLMEGPNLMIDQGLPVKFSHFEAGGQFFEHPTTIPTRMIVSRDSE